MLNRVFSGVPGIIEGIDADTSFFTGNFVPRVSLQGAALSPEGQFVPRGVQSRIRRGKKNKRFYRDYSHRRENFTYFLNKSMPHVNRTYTLIVCMYELLNASTRKNTHRMYVCVVYLSLSCAFEFTFN